MVTHTHTHPHKEQKRKYTQTGTKNNITHIPLVLLFSFFFLFVRASLHSEAHSTKRSDDTFGPYRKPFILLNISITLLLGIFFAILAQTNNIELKKLMYQIGISMICAINVCGSAGFIVFGMIYCIFFFRFVRLFAVMSICLFAFFSQNSFFSSLFSFVFFLLSLSPSRFCRWSCLCGFDEKFCQFTC